MTESKVDVIQADQIRAETACEGVFIRTRHACALAVSEARSIIQQSNILAEYPRIADNLMRLLDGVELKVCDVLLDKRWIEPVADAFARHRITTAREVEALQARVRELEGALRSISDWPDAAMGFESCSRDMRQTARAAINAALEEGETK